MKRAVKLAQALLFKFKRIRDQAEDVEKIVYRLQGGRAQNSAARGRAQETPLQECRH